jgi:NADH-quinone oxidoreductase subunit L
MSRVAEHLWLIPVLPLMAAGLSAVARRRHRKLSSSMGIGSMAIALVLSCAAFAEAVQHSGQGRVGRTVVNFPWFQIADTWLKLGWVLDPLTAVMLVMVCFVGLLIFIYSVGYMAHDENFTRFFCFLSLFAAAMLGLVIANSLLLLFICWELVGLTSYLLIGFWFHKPSAAAAAKKAFVTTRLGDIAFLLGILWLYSQTGTLLFYDHGRGCLEQPALAVLFAEPTRLGLAAGTLIGLLIFAGAIGKSGQVPLHVWLPDAMEGPTPVSALIHAATMVAAGVFLIARVYPLMDGLSLQAVTWVGAATAVFGASIAIAQSDIKRILAYSTVSQLGFMMMGLGTGGVAVGMFHLITHAFFKALLFLGAGSVIHGCQEEQDIRCLGGLRKFMPLTFATYAVGMMALSGVPLFFSGFWSKDGILHAAHAWPVSHWPFYLGIVGAFLTAFYMSRQVFLVFFGSCRLVFGRTSAAEQRIVKDVGAPIHARPETPQESPAEMTLPLLVLAACSMFLGFIGTPALPWFQAFLSGESLQPAASRLFEPGQRFVMLVATVVVTVGIALGWWLYGRNPVSAKEPDVLERTWPNLFTLLRKKYYVDEIYDWALVGLNASWARLCDWLDRWLWGGAVRCVELLVLGLAWIDRFVDEYVVNLGFDETCRRLTGTGWVLSKLQNGQIQGYLRVIGLGLIVLLLLVIWGCHA